MAEYQANHYLTSETLYVRKTIQSISPLPIIEPEMMLQLSCATVTALALPFRKCRKAWCAI